MNIFLKHVHNLLRYAYKTGTQSIFNRQLCYFWIHVSLIFLASQSNCAMNLRQLEIWASIDHAVATYILNFPNTGFKPRDVVKLIRQCLVCRRRAQFKPHKTHFWRRANLRFQSKHPIKPIGHKLVGIHCATTAMPKTLITLVYILQVPTTAKNFGSLCNKNKRVCHFHI